MKKLSYLFSMLFLMTFVLFTSCKDDEETPPVVDPVEEARDRLIGTWTVTSISRAGTAVELGSTTPTLVFGATSYSATGGDVFPGETPAFPTGTTWAFSSQTAPFNQIVISPSNVNFNTVAVTATTLSFTYTTQDEKSQGDDVVVTVGATKN